MSGSRKSRRGGGGRGGGRSGGNGGHGAVGQPQGGGAPQNPVEFYLYASEQFPMEQCPAQLKPANAVDGALRLAMPIREHLGDIIAWFSAMAPADPTARLVVCQATRSDKAWLQAFVKEGFSAQLQYGDVEDSHGNRLLQFSLLQAGSAAAVPPPLPPAAAKQEQPAAEQPVAAAASKAKDAVAHAAQHTKEASAEAGHKAGEAAAAAVGKAKETAAAAVAKAQEAGKAASSSVAAAVQQANGGAAQGTAEGEGSKQARTWSWSCGSSSWFEGAQAALTGKSGPNTQLMAVGGIALAVTTIVLGVLLGGKRKSRA